MLGRQDAENIYVMFSDDCISAHLAMIVKRSFPGIRSNGQLRLTIETEAGWLVLSHGVGHAKYCIGAFLLDRTIPPRSSPPARTADQPDENEREGTCPRRLFCGSLYTEATHHPMQCRLRHHVATLPLDGVCQP